jgi:hypothetical protein
LQDLTPTPLIFAPRLIRAAAEAQCFNAFIVAVPILGPPLLGRLVGTLPDIAELDLPQRLGTCLFVLLVAQSLFFLTLMRQLRDRPAVNMACVTRSLSMNSNPAKLFEELERTLQSRDLIGMRGRTDVAEFYANHLERFAGQLASVVAPVSTADEDRLGAIARVQQHMGAAPSLTAAATAQLAAPGTNVDVRLPPGRQRCRNERCRAEVPVEAMFCSYCGTPLRG